MPKLASHIKLLSFFFTCLLSAAYAQADDHKHGVLITNSWARATPPNITTSAIYLTIKNPTQNNLVVTGVRSPISKRIELHKTKINDGVMQMRKIDQIEISANSVFELKPHGTHVMIFDLQTALKTGDELSIELILKDSSPISVQVPVALQAIDDDQGHKHDHHQPDTDNEHQLKHGEKEHDKNIQHEHK